ncbi:MAG: protein kinase [Candidatus Promineifilaceae bacterium]
MSDLIGRTLGKYQIVVRVGRGGMARVYKAYQASLDRYVALKVLHGHLAEEDDFIQRFEREATAVARLRHPNIVQVYDYDTEDELYFIVMEFIEGPTLKAELIERRKRKIENGESLFTLDEVSRIISTLGDAIDYAHSRGMIHRDLKPGNIMFAADGEVLLADFGLARMVYASRHTRTGALSGTPAYMSPEQVQGTRVDTRSDTYSLGVIAYELLTGRVPFEADTTYAIMSKHVTDPVPSPSMLNASIYPEVEKVLLKVLRKEPDDRYQSAGDFSIALLESFGVSPEVPKKGPQFVPIATSVDSQEASPVSTYAGTTPMSQVLASSPYRGLYAFREEDAPYFFGRELFTERLVDTVTNRHMAAVIGPSGSGKSSVVFAGLLPTIRDRSGWNVLSIRPGSRPFHALAEVLVGEMNGDLGETDRLVEIRKLGSALKGGDLELDDVLGRLKKSQADDIRQLLVVDQFEELYTLCTDEEIRRKYPNVLFQAIAASRDRQDFDFTLVLTLRADFMGQALANRPFADALQDSDVKLGPMTRAELGRAIESPAGKKNVIFEAGLVDRILDDVGDEPGNLPLLEFALTLLWERRSGRRLTHSAYDAIGRVEGSLARYADEIYEQLGFTEQIRVRHIFTQMVRPGEGTEDTRRLATRDELGEEDWLLAQRLADARLVVTGLTPEGLETVEIVHEALIRGWGRLREWMNEERAFRTWQEKLRVALRQWEDSDRDEGALLRGVSLGEAEDWMRRQERDLSQPEREYIQASAILRENEAAEREAQRQRELESARHLAEEQRLRAEAEHQRAEEQLKSTKRFRSLTGILAAVFVIAVVAAILAVGQRQDAERQANARATEVVVRTTAESNAHESANLAATRADEAMMAQTTAEAERIRANQEAQDAEMARNDAEVERDRADVQAELALARQLAAQSTTLRGPQLDLALLLSLEAYNINESAETVGSILSGLQASPGLITYLREHPSLLQSAVFGPDGEILATVGSEGLVLLWDVASGTLLRELVGHDPSQLVNRAAFSPSGEMLATGSDDLSIILWDVESGEIVRRLLGHDNWVQALAFGPDGTQLISGGGDRSIHIWDIDTGQLRNVLDEHAGSIWDVAYSDDGEYLVSAGADNIARLYDAESGDIIQTFIGHNGPVFNVAISPDNERIATGSGDNMIIIWELDTGEPVGNPLVGHQAAILGLAFSPDGQLLASGSVDSTVALWDVESQQQLRLFGDHNGMVNTVEFSPDGDLLASGDLNGLAILWDVAAEGSQFIGRIEGLDGGVNRAVYYDDGNRLASAGVDGFIRLWDTSRGEPIGEPISHGMRQNEAVGSLTFSPNGQLLASGSDNGTIMLWDIESGQQISPALSTTTNGVLALEFSPDSSAIVGGSPGGFLSAWDVISGTQIGPFLAGHIDRVSQVSFSPDGQYLASGAEDGTIIIRPFADVVAGQGQGIPISYTTGITSAITALTFNPQSSLLASSDTDGTIALWDPASSQVVTQTSYQLLGFPRSMAFSPDGSSLAIGTSEGQISIAETGTLRPSGTEFGESGPSIAKLMFDPTSGLLRALGDDGSTKTWDIQDGRLVSESLPLESTPGSAVAMSPNGGAVAIVTTDNFVNLVKTRSGAPIALQLSHGAIFTGAVTDIVVSSDGSIIASAGVDGAIVIRDSETLEVIGEPLVGHSSAIFSLAISPDGSLIASGSCSQFHLSGNCLVGEIFIWDIASGEIIAATNASVTLPFGLAFDPDGSILAFSDCDRIEIAAQCLEGAIQFWDFKEEEFLDRYSGHTSAVLSLDYNPDGDILASASADNTIILWDTATGQPIGQRLTNHGGPVTRVKFSQDGSLLASGGFDDLVFLWDVASGQALGGPYAGHTGNVMDVTFSPDDQILASSSLDGSMVFLDIDLESWRKKACSIANRNLRIEEWEQFLGERNYRETCPDK